MVIKLHNAVHLYFSHSRNHMQLWVQVLEKANEDNADWQPALVEEDALTNTGGVFVLAKVKSPQHIGTYIAYVIVAHIRMYTHVCMGVLMLLNDCINLFTVYVSVL